jgi:hypothetical protein
MSYSLSPVLTPSPPPPLLPLLASTVPSPFPLSSGWQWARHSDISISFVYHRRTDSDLIRQPIRSAGGQGRLSGLYNTFLARFYFRQQFPLDTLRRHGSSAHHGSRRCRLLYFSFFIFPDVRGRPTSTWHTTAEDTAIDLREFLISLTRDTQQLVASATKGGRGRQQRDTGLGKIPGGGFFFFFSCVFFHIIVCMRGWSKVMFRDACLGQLRWEDRL